MTKKLTEKKRTNRPVSVLMKVTMSAMLLALVAVRAEDLTIPQLEYRYDDAKASVKSTEKALDKAMDALKDAQKASRKAADDLLEEKGDLARLKAKFAKASEKDQAKIATAIEEKQASIAAAEKLAAKSEKNAEEARTAADEAQKAFDRAFDNKKVVEQQLAAARDNAPDIVAKRALEKSKADRKAAEVAYDQALDDKNDADKKLAKAQSKLAEADKELKEAQAVVAAKKAAAEAAPEDKKEEMNKEVAAAEAEAAAAQRKHDELQENTNAIEVIAKDANAKAATAETAKADADKAFAEAEANLDKARAQMKADQAAADAEAKSMRLAKKQAEDEAAKKAATEALAKRQAEKESAEKGAVVAADGSYTTSWAPAPERELPALRGGQRLTVPEAKDADIADEAAVIPEFDVTMVSGDKDVVEKLQIWKDWSAFIVFNKVTPKMINEFHGQLLKALHEEGYVFAQVSFPSRIWSTGIFLAKVDLGKLGDITVKNQKHYSPEQIARALRSDEGNFNYNKINRDLYDLNIKPDLKLNTQLSTSTINGRRVINADIDVKDSLPIHAAVELSNTGSKASDSDWRLRTTLQHLNLTQHGDVLTLDWLTGINVADDINAYSASYFLPIDGENHINIYGGYSSNDVDDVLPELSVRGKGFFAGFSWTHTLYETVRDRIEISLGWFYQKHESYEEFDDVKYEEGDLTVSMPTITLGYSSKIFDSYNGRNFASLTLKQNRAGAFDSSPQRYFEKSINIDGDFFIANLQLARFQRLFAGEDHPGKWTLYAKTNAQASSDHLPSMLREYVGGMMTVRGYIESELGGDHAVSGTLELRTPLLEDFIPGLKQDDPDFRDRYPDHWSQHRLQFVAFTDFGYVCEDEKESGADDQSFLSVGAGIRLGITKFAQMSVDYGYPIIEASKDTPDNGRLHVTLQLQF